MLAQNGGAWEYLLPDALGSVRQIADANGNVTLAESYEPYGSVLNSTGTASSIFGYAGEQFDTTGLIYLRARYMNPRLGIFLARDPWSGDVMRPGSMNGFGYGLGNPILFVDPSGWVVECANTSIYFPYEDRYRIACALAFAKYVKDTPDGLQALITLFETDAFGADRSAKHRLEFILEQTKWPFPDLNLGVQFANEFSNCGIPPEFNDSDLYRAHGFIDQSKSGQINHFLTAVRFGYDTSFVSRVFRVGLGILQGEPVETVAIKLIVGHEKVADDRFNGPFGTGQIGTAGAQYQAATTEDVNAFLQALRLDATGDAYVAHNRPGQARAYFGSRDQLLKPILGQGYQEDPENPTNYRKGNSIQDLRLSIKGYRFGQDIRYDRLCDRVAAANWLRRNLLLH